MHPLLYHIATVFLLLLFPLKDVSVFLQDYKQIAVLSVPAEDEQPGPPEQKNNEEKDFQYEFVPLYHRAGILAMPTAAIIIRMHRRFAYHSAALSAVPTPPPEIN